MLDGTPFSRTVSNEELRFDGGAGWDNGASLSLSGKDRPDLGLAGAVMLRASDGSQSNKVTLYPSGDFVWGDGSVAKHIAMREDVVPRSGGAVLTGTGLGRTVNNSTFTIYGGRDWFDGALIALYGKNESSYNPTRAGDVQIRPDNGSNSSEMHLYPSGTWTWGGTACQIPSDQRLKQQIAEIDDKLLDAWEDVELVQFKYNDAVDQKGDTARLHTGYVVQQIDEACKSHNLDISAYGLYCHEEYPERTEEVTTENEDGTTSKETKVIEPAREHYSLRYTETLVVECAYLRREVSRLKQQNENLEQRLKMLENK